MLKEIAEETAKESGETSSSDPEEDPKEGDANEEEEEEEAEEYWSKIIVDFTLTKHFERNWDSSTLNWVFFVCINDCRLFIVVIICYSNTYLHIFCICFESTHIYLLLVIVPSGVYPI